MIRAMAAAALLAGLTAPTAMADPADLEPTCGEGTVPQAGACIADLTAFLPGLFPGANPNVPPALTPLNFPITIPLGLTFQNVPVVAPQGLTPPSGPVGPNR